MTTANTHSKRSLLVDNMLIPLGMLLILLSTAVPFFMRGNATAIKIYPYVYAAGAVLLLLLRLFTPYKGKDLRLKRLYRIDAWVPVFFCAAAFFLFYPGAEMRDWIAFTLAGAALRIFTSIAIPLRESKLKAK